jgi:hypothetical protein
VLDNDFGRNNQIICVRKGALEGTTGENWRENFLADNLALVLKYFPFFAPVFT